MTEILTVHQQSPQLRLLERAAAIIKRGGVIVYPTDSGYALGCSVGNKQGADRIRQIRGLARDHNFTLICRDLSQISTYAVIHRPAFRILKSYTPGPYTFLFKATKEVPRKLRHPQKKTVGLRFPDHRIALSLLEALGEPMMTSTLILPDHEMAIVDPRVIKDILGKRIDLIIDGGQCGLNPTSVLDLSGDKPVVIRAGSGDISAFLSS